MTHPLAQVPRNEQGFKDRQTAYKLVFTSPAGQMVMADLMNFCRAHETTFNADPRIHALLEGRREVWLRIMNHVELSHAQALAVFGGKTFVPAELTKSDAED